MVNTVPQFEYSAWFRDESLPADQQGHLIGRGVLGF
jgi:hypothetical protein